MRRSDEVPRGVDRTAARLYVEMVYLEKVLVLQMLAREELRFPLP